MNHKKADAFRHRLFCILNYVIFQNLPFEWKVYSPRQDLGAEYEGLNTSAEVVKNVYNTETTFYVLLTTN